MANVAVLVGNSNYKLLADLPCCHADLLVMKELLEAAKKYDDIEVVENVEADQLKSKLRELADRTAQVEELFFYFTGHGYQQTDDFYYCSSDFDSKRPNKTGVSNSELHTLLRLADANLVVKVVDACNSGTLLVKEGIGFAPQRENEFKNLIQISSCLESQNSLTGDPLSVFTEKFRAAALRKQEGVIYYTDIIYALRDEFLDNNDQTPFFVSQGTGREQFVDNAKCFDELRSKLSSLTASSNTALAIDRKIRPEQLSLKDMLEKAERNIATADQVALFVNGFFDKLTSDLVGNEASDLFDVDFIEHPNFQEVSTRSFMIRILSKEPRPDNFVTANITSKRSNYLSSLEFLTALEIGSGRRERSDVYTLELNCSMQKAQLKITLTPKYSSLRQIVLVVTCAPSLETCYIFEVVTQHRLKGGF